MVQDMKILSELLSEMEYGLLCGSTGIGISSLVYDSRKVCDGSLFVCIAGANFDGHDAILEVAEKGAKAVVVSRDVTGIPEGLTVIKVSDSRYALACLSAAWFSHPAKKLTTIGITGTKGKTTTTYLVKSILEAAGRKVGLIGTIETIIGDEHIPSLNTTPESYILQESFAKMAESGIDTVVMECSSQGFMLHRTAGFIFDYGIFTNISPDHIGPNEHDSFDDYLHCKGMLFKQCRVGIANGDDPHLQEVVKGHTCSLMTYGFSEGCDLRADDTKLTNTMGRLGVSFNVTDRDGSAFRAEIGMPGRFSVYNALCAIAICRQFGTNTGDIQGALLNAHVKGRIENVPVPYDFTLLIDYAHNAMALESLLVTLREYSPKRLISVFGCGGNRSKLRRYEMGEVSGKLADLTVITSDNPRFEEPLDIIADIRTGISKTDGKYIEIADRREAIRYCIENGQEGDVIVLAGKGHEDYQEIRGKKYPMDERVLVKEILSGK